MRRRARFDGAQKDLALYLEARISEASPGGAEMDDDEIEDDRLRLIFTCCHPALPRESGAKNTSRIFLSLTPPSLLSRGTLHSSKARKKKNFLDDLSNSGRPFDYMVKAGQPARPRSLQEEDRYWRMEKS